MDPDYNRPGGGDYELLLDPWYRPEKVRYLNLYENSTPKPCVLQYSAGRVKLVAESPVSIPLQENTLSKESSEPSASGESRRSFLAKLGFGAATIALAAGSLTRLGSSGGKGTDQASNDFPDEDSIFHPANNPRTDPRRKG